MQGLGMELVGLQELVQDRAGLNTLGDYFNLCIAFLRHLETTKPTRIISPTNHGYIFFQYGETFSHRITRPLNSNLYYESADLTRLSWPLRPG
jgi:hypothetical protein